MEKIGIKRFALDCQVCGMAFALPFDVPVLNLAALQAIEDPYPAKCPHCEAERLYPRRTIGVLLEV